MDEKFNAGRAKNSGQIVTWKTAVKNKPTKNSNGYDRAASSISAACFQALFSRNEAFL